MGKRGGKRRRRKDTVDATPEETVRTKSPRQQLEVCIEEGEVATENNKPPSIPPPLPASMMCQPTDDNVDIKRLQNCWSNVEQRKGKTNLVPTMIQLQTWSLLMPGPSEQSSSTGDYSKHFQTILGLAPTGSGKTLAYGLPMLLRAASCNEKESGPRVFGLVLVPTRELASQVSRELKSALISSMGIRIVAVYGGVDKEKQHQSLVEGYQNKIVVATPGRLVDLLSPGEREGDTGEHHHGLTRVFSSVSFIVMDEADRLAMNTDMARQVEQILGMLPPCTDRIMCLFSATFPERIRSMWANWAPGRRVCIKVNTLSVGASGEGQAANETNESAETTNATMDDASGHDDESATKKRKHPGGPLDLAQIPSHIIQTLHVCAPHKKPRKLLITLSKIRGQESNQRNKSLCLIFFATIKTLQYMHKLLVKEGVKCTELHSQMPQDARERALVNFRSGKIPTILATDIAARGIHCNNIEHVINYDFPGSLEQYVHRCGRAGRNQIYSEDAPPSKSVATVYSFFTRNLAPMASDMVSLLRASRAWVDPNLVELINESPSKIKANKSGRKRSKQAADQVSMKRDKAEALQDVYADENSDDDAQFRHLNPKRIALKRASHVASDSSDDDDESIYD